MSRRSLFLPSRFVGTLVAGAALLAMASPGLASCYNEKQQLPAQQIANFLSDPQQLLKGSGGQLVSRVRDLVASDPATLNAILGLLPNATPEQKASIGSGLGQSARICVRTDQAFAAQIQQAVVDNGDREMILAYQATTGDTLIAAGESAGGAGGGSAGAAGGGAGGGAEGIGGGGVNTGAFGFTVGVTGNNPVTTGGGGTSIFSSVSP